MGILLEIIVPVFGLVAIGFVAARSGFFPQSAARGLSRFVFDFAIPAMLFRTMVTTEMPRDIPWSYLISYYGAAYIAWAAGTLISAVGFKAKRAEPAVAGMTAGFSNTAMLGIPVVLTTFGERATLPLFLLIAFHSWQLFSLVTIQAELGVGARQEMRNLPLNVARSLTTNPIILALLLGLAVNLLGLPLPHFLDRLTETLGQAALPCAVFAMGAAVAAYRIAGALPEASVGVLLKLVIHPLLVWLLSTQVFEIDPLWRDVAVLMAAMPVGMNVYLMAQRYHSGTAQAATSVLLSTALSVLSVGGVLWLLDVR